MSAVVPVCVLILASALLTVDRFMIVPMFPMLMKELRISYGDLPWVNGVTAIAWGLAAVPASLLATRYGIRNFLLAAIALFALVATTTGIASDLGSLVVIRFAVGLVTGAFSLVVINAIMLAVPPRHRGLAVGAQQAFISLVALAIAPILVSDLLPHTGWRWMFGALSVPAAGLFAIMYLVLRRQHKLDKPKALTKKGADASIRVRLHKIVGSKGIWTATAILSSSIGGLVLTGALLPSYLVDRLGLSMAEMGYVMSATGFGGIVGGVVMPALSDRLGRKPITMLCAMLALCGLLTLMISGPGPNAQFASLFFMNFFSFPMIAIAIGPLCADAVSEGDMALASGFTLCVAELTGGGLIPTVAGWMLGDSGHGSVFPCLALTAILGIIGALLIPSPYRETQCDGVGVLSSQV